MLRSACVVSGPVPPGTRSRVPGAVPSEPDTNTWSPAMTAWENAGSRPISGTFTLRRVGMRLLSATGAIQGR